MARKPTLKTIKKKADQVFSEYIRRLRTDHTGRSICVTCGKIAHWKELQAGHYFKRHHLGTRFHEDNVHCQCQQCNIFKNGNYTAYASFMYNKFGVKKMEHLESLSRKPLKLTISDYQTLIAGWKQMMERMNGK